MQGGSEQAHDFENLITLCVIDTQIEVVLNKRYLHAIFKLTNLIRFLK